MARAGVTPLSPAGALAGWARAAIVTGAVGSALLAAGGVLVGPRTNVGTPVGAAFVGRVSPGWAAAGWLAVVVGGVLLTAAWLVAGQTQMDVRRLRRVLLLWSLPLAAVPPLFSRDLYSYAAQGRMVALHLNPYRHGPVVLGRGSWVAPVSRVWRLSPSPYGPALLAVYGWAARVAHTAGRTVELMRLLTWVAVAVTGVTVPALARRLGADPARALWAVVLNPVMILHGISGGHNDVVMLALASVALLGLCDGQLVAAGVMAGLAAAVKAPAGVVILTGAAWLAGRGATGAAADAGVVRAAEVPLDDDVLAWRPTVAGGRDAAGFVIAAATTFVVATVVSRAGWGWITALTTPGRIQTTLTPTLAAASVVAAAAHVVGIGRQGLLSLAVLHGVGLVVAAGLVALAVVASPRLGPLRAAGLALLGVVTLGPVVQPWYLLWPLLLLVPLGGRRLDTAAVGTAVAVMVAVSPSGSAAPDVLVSAGLVVLVLGWLPFTVEATGPVLAALRSRITARRPAVPLAP